MNKRQPLCLHVKAVNTLFSLLNHIEITHSAFHLFAKNSFLRQARIFAVRLSPIFVIQRPTHTLGYSAGITLLHEAAYTSRIQSVAVFLPISYRCMNSSTLHKNSLPCTLGLEFRIAKNPLSLVVFSAL